MSKVILEKLTPAISVITLHDPDSLNAMGEGMARDFRAVVDSLRSERENLSAIILTGSGKAFSAGGDLKMLDAKRSLSPEENRLRMLAFYDSFLCIRELEVPLIAAINGAAVGAGMCVASACDIRVVAEEAKIGFTFVRLGLHPGMGATFFLPQILGVGMAAELLLTGRIISASEAHRIGLVSRVVKSTEVMKEARAMADEICSGGPESIRQLLVSLRSPQPALSDSLSREAQCQSVNYASAEFAEGLSAVREKRPAKFR